MSLPINPVAGSNARNQPFYFSPEISTNLNQLDLHLCLVQSELHQVLAPLKAEVDALRAQRRALNERLRVEAPKLTLTEILEQYPEYREIDTKLEKAREADESKDRTKIRFLQEALERLECKVKNFKDGKVVVSEQASGIGSLESSLPLVCLPVPAEVSELARLRIDLVNCLASKIDFLFKRAVYQKNIQDPTKREQAIASAQKEADYMDKISKNLEQRMKALESKKEE